MGRVALVAGGGEFFRDLVDGDRVEEGQEQREEPLRVVGREIAALGHLEEENIVQFYTEFYK